MNNRNKQPAGKTMKNHGSMKENSKLRVNALPIIVKEEEREPVILFWKEKKKDRIPLQKREYPETFQARYAATAEECEYLYGDLTADVDGHPEISQNEPYAVPVKLEVASAFARHFLHYKLEKVLKPAADYIARNFIESPELWFRYPSEDEGELEAYRKFRIKVVRRWYTDGFGLSVIYSGISWRYPHAVISDDERVETTDLNRVLYNGYQFRYEDIPDDVRGEIDFTQVYPVVNYKIRKKLGLFSVPDPGKNRVKGYAGHIEWFREEILSRKEIADRLPFTIPDKGWAVIPGDGCYQVGREAARLQFRGGKEDVNPYTGMKKYGPSRPAPANHYRFIYIMANSDIEGTGKKLHNYVKGKVKGVTSLARFSNIAGRFSGEFIGFDDEENPLPEIIDGINRLEKRPGVKDYAMYITPYEKHEQDPRKRRVYYRVKEELLKKKIVSQAVERSTILEADFRFVMPNIAVAALAKLGGIPWQLAEPPGKDLIVGIGAFKPKEFSKRYIGSAFCFRSNGTFMGLRCFSKDEPRMLAGSIREAVTEYVKENGEAERLVIHFYKKMSYRERKPVMEMLQSLGLDIPVVVLTINKTEYEEVVLFDDEHPQMIPVSGTYIYQRKNDVLLCNNTRHRPGDRIKRGFYFPIRIQLWASDDDHLAAWPDRQVLIRQVYQFSRLYWKSVSQQSIPVTIKYPEMVAEIFPWFENLSLPLLGRKSLWFL